MHTHLGAVTHTHPNICTCSPGHAQSPAQTPSFPLHTPCFHTYARGHFHTNRNTLSVFTLVPRCDHTHALGVFHTYTPKHDYTRTLQYNHWSHPNLHMTMHSHGGTRMSKTPGLLGPQWPRFWGQNGQHTHSECPGRGRGTAEAERPGQKCTTPARPRSTHPGISGLGQESLSSPQEMPRPLRILTCPGKGALSFPGCCTGLNGSKRDHG